MSSKRPIPVIRSIIKTMSKGCCAKDKIPLTVLLFLTVLFVVSLASAADIGGYAGAFLRMGTTARSLALGGGMTAAVDNGFAAYHNPAAVAFLKKRHVSVFHHFLPLDRYLVSTTFASSLPPSGGVGIALLNAGVDDIDGRDRSGHYTGTLSTAEYAAYFSFANELIEGISIGVNVKVLYQLLPVDSEGKSRGTGVDVGILIQRFKKFDLGFVLQDLNTRYAWNTSKIFDEQGRNYDEYFPRQVRVGFAYHPGIFEVIGDYTFILGGESVTAHRIRIGGEYKPMSNLSIRAGINQFFPTIGLGLNYSLFKRDDTYVDYAFLLGRRGEGISHVFTYIFTF